MGKTKQDTEKKGRHAAAAGDRAASAGAKAASAAGGSKHAAATGVPGTTGALQTGGIDMSAADKASRAPKVVGIVLGVLVALVAAAYVAGAVYFMDRFFPNTSVKGADISLMSSGEAETALATVADGYSLSVSGCDFTLEMSADELGLSFDAAEVVTAMRADENAWMWPFELAGSHDETACLAASYDAEAVGAVVHAAVDEHNATATPSSDATVGYDAEAGRINVIPEVYGTELDADAVLAAVDAAVTSLEPKVELGQEQLVAPVVLAGESGLRQAADQANTMAQADMTLMMGESVAAKVNVELIADWIEVGEDYQAHLDEAQLSAWIDELADACNTLGSERTYTRPDGKVVTVSGGSYGFEVDRAALHTLVTEGVAAGSIETVDVPCAQSGYAFNGAGGQDWGNRYVDVDLSEQYARFYDDAGDLVWETDVITGKPTADMATPTGVYVVNLKSSPTTLYTYEAGEEEPKKTVVQYWMPFVGNVIGLHDAWWQWGFGGTMYQDGYGSHGCVNLPSDKAEELYGMINVGDVVVVHW